ncbi:glycoside hydrolase family 2 [Saccharobesus litoralis]|uniref:beta-mannosidase n=1 Tax=Saccharobesus litoralis TaxID=2172099 RepID=A0A2S0VN41_9ALTE|nr:sugar-binding domain-containing protein [Saccharobesus litoralis]AWB65641.1 glycoside hydrolase family 2 [Saccharobesus litoralis]
MSRINLDLSGARWQMERMRPGQGEIEGLHLLPAEYQGTHFSWNFATIPGDVYTDLHRANEIADPYFGRNMHRAKWVAEYEWWYSRRFTVPDDMQGKRIRLIFEGVDYSCSVWLNGHYLGRHEGMFSAFEFDISDVVSFEDWRDGSNMLMVKLDPPPKNYRNCGGKKVNFSGDYFSGLVPFGIWRPVRIEATEQVRIDNIRTDVTVQNAEQGQEKAQIAATYTLVNDSDETQVVNIETSLQGKNCDTHEFNQTINVDVPPGEHEFSTSIKVANAKLWWPWDMGEQNLYQIDVKLVQGDVELDNSQEVIGLRQVTMDFNPGYTRDDNEFPWTFKINGKRHFLRSTCWGGQPSFLYGRNSLKKYEDRVAMVREANINNLRIFGWHPPEIPDFYRLCDELGITVWTNFTLATQAYPSDQEFIDGVLHECVATVKERRNHASQIFWMGGEEVFFSGAHERSGNKQLMEVIGKAVNQQTNIPYGLASPLSSESAQNIGFKPHESMHANEHYYQGGKEFMEEYYPALDCAIIPELTAASAPDIESLKKFIPEDELWPMGPSWAYHWADIDILKNLNFEVFNDYKMGSLEEFVEATQVAQGTVIQFALETYRRRKPKVSGVSLCHFMTHVPDIKWGIIDYYGKKKQAFDWLKRTYQPLLPSLAFSKRRWDAGSAFKGELWVVNDYQYGFENLTLEWQVLYQGQSTGVVGQQALNVELDSAREFAEIKWDIPTDASGDFTIAVALRNGEGKVLSSNAYTLLIGNQQAAKEQSLKYLAEATERIEKYGHSIYRYWPEMYQEME